MIMNRKYFVNRRAARVGRLIYVPGPGDGMGRIRK